MRVDNGGGMTAANPARQRRDGIRADMTVPLIGG